MDEGIAGDEVEVLVEAARDRVRNPGARLGGCGERRQPESRPDRQPGGPSQQISAGDARHETLHGDCPPAGGPKSTEARAQLGGEGGWVPGFPWDPDDLLAAVLFQPRVAGFVVAFFPGAAVGLVGVELDDEVVAGP